MDVLGIFVIILAEIMVYLIVQGDSTLLIEGHLTVVIILAQYTSIDNTPNTRKKRIVKPGAVYIK